MLLEYLGAAACRFLLGVFEAPITPGITIAMGHWWTRSEAPLRYNFIYSALGWAGILGSLMSTGISKDSDAGPVKRWQLIFIVVSIKYTRQNLVDSSSSTFKLGVLTTVWGFILFALLPDSPVDAKFFKHEERVLAASRVASNQVGQVLDYPPFFSSGLTVLRIKSAKFKLYQVKAALLDFKVYCIVISVFAAGVPFVSFPSFLLYFLLMNSIGFVSVMAL
jgi:hypothetical protein